MKQTEIRLSRAFFEAMVADLRRPHKFAAERVGFAWGRFEPDAGSKGLVLLNGYQTVDEAHYIKDRTVGVRISGDAIRWAMQLALDGQTEQTCVFHVHLHDFRGKPQPSRTDSMEIPPMVRSIARLAPEIPHGFLILSANSMAAWVLQPETEKLVEAGCYVCGAPAILVSGRLA